MDGQEPTQALDQIAVDLRQKLLAFFAKHADSSQAEDYYQTTVTRFLARVGKGKNAKPLDNPKAYLWGIARKTLCTGPYLEVRREKQPIESLDETNEPAFCQRMEETIQAAYLLEQLTTAPEYHELLLYGGDPTEVSELARRRGIGARSMSGRLCRLKDKFLADYGQAVHELLQ